MHYIFTNVHPESTVCVAMLRELKKQTNSHMPYRFTSFQVMAFLQNGEPSSIHFQPLAIQKNITK